MVYIYIIYIYVYTYIYIYIYIYMHIVCIVNNYTGVSRQIWFDFSPLGGPKELPAFNIIAYYVNNIDTINTIIQSNTSST